MALFNRLRLYRESRSARMSVAGLVIIIGFSLSIVYANVQTFDPIQASESGYPDTIDYIEMYRGGTGDGIRGYRPLVPRLARLVPDPPSALFNQRRGSDPLDTSSIALKFGLVNFVFLVGACIAFFILLRDFGYCSWQAFLGILLFLSSQTVIRSAGLPMTDTAFYFFFLVCLIGLVRGQFWTVLLGAAVGILAKELIVLAAPLALLTSHRWRSRLQLCAAFVPALVVHGLVRAVSPAPPHGLPIDEVWRLGDQVEALLSVNGSMNLFMAFGLVWIPALFALFTKEIPPMVRRWLWLVPLVLAGVLGTYANFGRSTFIAFPIVIPLAVSGLVAWVHSAAPLNTRHSS